MFFEILTHSYGHGRGPYSFGGFCLIPFVNKGLKEGKYVLSLIIIDRISLLLILWSDVNLSFFFFFLEIQIWMKKINKEVLFNCFGVEGIQVWITLTKVNFLAHRAIGHVSYCYHLVSVVILVLGTCFPLKLQWIWMKPIMIVP